MMTIIWIILWGLLCLAGGIALIIWPSEIIARIFQIPMGTYKSPALGQWLHPGQEESKKEGDDRYFFEEHPWRIFVMRLTGFMLLIFSLAAVCALCAQN
jgi:hypothetical protein